MPAALDTLTAAARALALACLVTGCATMESRSRIGTFDDLAPLHAAAFAGTVPLIKQLLADGARVNAKAENSWEGPTVGRLSRVAQLRGSDPSHRSSAHLESDHLANGIGDHLALERLITLEWNR